jgi:hypothetical protein
VPLSFDTRTGVANSDLGVATIRRQLGCDADVAFECELKGIRDEIEHHLLPHVGVDVDLVRQRWAIDNQTKPGPFDSGSEVGGEFCRKDCEVDGQQKTRSCRAQELGRSGAQENEWKKKLVDRTQEQLVF